MKLSISFILFVFFFCLLGWEYEHHHDAFKLWFYLGMSILTLAITIAFWTADIVIFVLSNYFNDEENP